MKLSREKIQRMVDVGGGTSAGDGGIGSSMLVGYATQNWVETNFLSLETGGRVEGPVYINDRLDVYGLLTCDGGRQVATQEWVGRNFVKAEWFDKIFQVFNDSTKIAVNGTLPSDTSRMNIKAMFGFWTDFYVSALGNGGQAGNAIYLSQLADVNVGVPTNGQALVWNSSTNKWVAGTPSSGTVISVGLTMPQGFSVSNSPITSSGVLTVNFANGYSLPTNTKQSQWDTAYGWGNHATAGYATQTWVGQQGFSTTSWVSTNFASKTLESYFDSNGNAKSALKLTTVSKTAWGQTYWTANGVPDSISGNMSNVGNISFSASGKNIGGIAYFDTTNSRIGIGTSSPSYALHVSGVVYASTGVYSSGYVTALSDMRCKHVMSNLVLDAERVARAPLFRYRWKDGHDNLTHVGSSAQYWQGILPEAVTDHNGRLTMDYGVIALTSVISVASRMMKLEERVRILEAQIENLING